MCSFRKLVTEAIVECGLLPLVVLSVGCHSAGGDGMAAGRLAMIGNLLIRAKRGLANIATLRYHSMESRKLLLLVLQKVLIT